MKDMILKLFVIFAVSAVLMPFSAIADDYGYYGDSDWSLSEGSSSSGSEGSSSSAPEGSSSSASSDCSPTEPDIADYYQDMDGDGTADDPDDKGVNRSPDGEYFIFALEYSENTKRPVEIAGVEIAGLEEHIKSDSSIVIGLSLDHDACKYKPDYIDISSTADNVVKDSDDFEYMDQYSTFNKKLYFDESGNSSVGEESHCVQRKSYGIALKIDGMTIDPIDPVHKKLMEEVDYCDDRYSDSDPMERWGYEKTYGYNTCGDNNLIHERRWEYDPIGNPSYDETYDPTEDSSSADGETYA